MSNVVLRPVVFTQYISDPTIAIPATFVAPSSGISAWSTGVAEMVKVVPLNVPGIIFLPPLNFWNLQIHFVKRRFFMICKPEIKNKYRQELLFQNDKRYSIL